MSIPRTIVQSSICAALLVGLFAGPALSRPASDADASLEVTRASSPKISKDEAIAPQATPTEPIALTAFDLVRAARKVYCKDLACGPTPNSDELGGISDTTAASAKFGTPDDVISLSRHVSRNLEVGLICPPSLVTATIHW